MPVKWIEYKGKRVLYIDCRKADSDELLRLMMESKETVLTSPTRVRCLGNVEGASPSPKTMQGIRKQFDATASGKLEKLALVGVTGVKEILLDALVTILGKSGTQIRSFKTEEEALKWLSE